MTIQEIMAEIKKLKAQNAVSEARLEKLQSAEVRVSPVDKQQANKSYADNLKHWRKRKRMCKDIIDAIQESSGKKYKVLCEEAGVENDEDVGVDPNAYK